MPLFTNISSLTFILEPKGDCKFSLNKGLVLKYAVIIMSIRFRNLTFLSNISPIQMKKIFLEKLGFPNSTSKIQNTGTKHSLDLRNSKEQLPTNFNYPRVWADSLTKNFILILKTKL